MAANRKLMIELVAVTKQFAADMKNMNGVMGGFMKSVQNTGGKLNQLGVTSAKQTKDISYQHQSMGASITRTMIYATAAYLAFKNTIGSLIQTNYELGSTLSRTNAMFKQLGTSSYELSDAYLSMGRSANQFLAASAEFVRIGVKESEQLKSMSRDAWMFGEVMGMSTAEAAKSMASISAVTGKTKEDLGSLINVAAMLKQNYGASTAAIEGSVRAMPAMTKALGLQHQNVMALAAGFEQFGLSGAEAAGMVGTMINKLGDPRERFKLNQLGMDADILQKSLATDGVAAVNQIGKAFKENAPQAIWLLKSWGFSEEQISAMQNAAGNTERMMQIMLDAGKAAKNSSTLMNLFSSATFNLKDQIEFLSEEVGAFITRLGTYLNPVLAVVTRMFRAIFSVIRMIPTPVLALGGAAAAIGAIIMAGLTLAALAVLGLARAYSRLGRALRETVAEVKLSVFWNNILNMGIKEGIKVTLLSTIADLKAAIMKNYLELSSKKLFATTALGNVLNKAYTASISALTSAESALGVKNMFVQKSAMGLNATLAANPIGLVAIALIALTVAFIGFYHWMERASTGAKLLAFSLSLILFPIAPMLTSFFSLYYVIKLAVVWFGTLYDVIADVLSPLGELYSGFSRVFTYIGEVLDKASGSSKGFFGIMSDIGRGALRLFFAFNPLTLILRGIVLTLQFLGAVVVGVMSAFWDVFGDIIKPLQEAFSGLYGSIKSVMDLFGGGEAGKSAGFLLRVLRDVAKTTSFIVKLILFNPIVIMLRVFVGVLTTIVRGVESVIDRVMKLGDTFRDWWQVVVDIKKRLFGSSFFHIAEGIAGIMPAVRMLQNAFSIIFRIIRGVKEAIQDAFTTLISVVTDALKPLMNLYNIVSSIFSMIGGGPTTALATTVGMPAPAAAESSAGVIGAAEVAKAAPAEGRERGSVPNRGGGNIVVPVSLSLDGEIIAQVIAKVSADQMIRYGNNPFGPMRGIPG